MAYTGWLIDNGQLLLACSGTDAAEVQAELTKRAGEKPSLLVDLSIDRNAVLDALVAFAKPYMRPNMFMASLAAAVQQVARMQRKQMYLGWYIADGHLRLGVYGKDYDATLCKLAEVAGNNVQIVLPAFGGQRDLWDFGKRNGIAEDAMAEDVANAERNFAAIPKADG